MDIREKALAFASKAHEGQFRKNSKLEYITHPIAVAEIALEYAKQDSWLDDSMLDQIYVVALLHDTLEDSPNVTLDLIRENFGMSIALAVKDLTKIEGETYLDAILRAKRGYVTRIVKISDNTHNMSDLKEGTLKDKYRLSKYILEN